MVVLTALLSFPDSAANGLQIRKVNSIRIAESFKDISSKAEIVLPKNVKLFQNNAIRDVFKRGHRVTIDYGYDNRFKREFEGYITSVSADVPIMIKCEDEMWKIKQIPVNFSASKTTLLQLLTTICPGYQIDCLEGVELGSIRLSKTTVAAVLDKLNSDFGLWTYMKGKTIVCGKYYSDDSAIPPVRFNLDRVASNSLQYRIADELPVKVKGTSIRAKGEKLEFEFGEDGGDIMNLSYYNIPTKEALEKLVNQDYQRRKVDGFSGSFTAFGIPTIDHGFKADISSILYPERSGQYYVDSLVKEYSTAGIRRAITLGRKVNA